MLAALLLAVVPALPIDGPSFSACIPSSPNPQHVCDFLAEVDWEGGEYVIVLSEKVGMDGQYAKWKRTDAVFYPNPKSTTSNMVGGSGTLCEYNGKKDDQVIAIAAYAGSQQWLTSISHAWKVDVTTKKLIEISPKNVRCENEGWGV